MRKLKLFSFGACLLIWASAGAAQLRQIAIVDVPGHPGFDAIALAGNYVVIAHAGADTVDVFDPAKRRVIAQIKDMKQPRGLAVDERAGRVYVANAGDNTIAVISVENWQVAQSIPLQVSPDALRFVPETDSLYIANWHNDSLSVLKADARQAQTLELDGRPDAMVYDAERKLLFVTLEDKNEVIGLDSALKVSVHFPVRASMPSGLALDAAQHRLFVAVRYAVVVLDAATGAEVGRVATPAGVDQIWFEDSVRTAFAASNGGAVTMIRSEAGKYYAEQELNTTVRGHTIAFDAARGLVYVPGGFEGRSKLVILKRIETAPQQASTKLTIH